MHYAVPLGVLSLVLLASGLAQWRLERRWRRAMGRIVGLDKPPGAGYVRRPVVEFETSDSKPVRARARNVVLHVDPERYPHLAGLGSRLGLFPAEGEEVDVWYTPDRPGVCRAHPFLIRTRALFTMGIVGLAVAVLSALLLDG